MPRAVDCIVIGSGVGGLTCASLIAQCGKKVLVLEVHSSAGGATQSFQEGKYQFEMGLQDVGAQVWLGERSREGPARLLHAASDGQIEWLQLATPDVPQHAVVVEDGPEFAVHAPWEKQRASLVARFPDEAEAIDKYRTQVVATREDAVDYMFSRIAGQPPRQPAGAVADARPRRPGAARPAAFGFDGLRHGAQPARGRGQKVRDNGRLHGRRRAEPPHVQRRAQVLPHVLVVQVRPAPPRRQLGRVLHHGGPVRRRRGVLLAARQRSPVQAFPRGGAGAIERALGAVIAEHGGKLFVSGAPVLESRPALTPYPANAPAARVSNVEIENGVCVGCRMDDGRVVRCAKVISNAGASNTFERLVPKSAEALIKVGERGAASRTHPGTPAHAGAFARVARPQVVLVRLAAGVHGLRRHRR
jgi:hypothetical protein